MEHKKPSIKYLNNVDYLLKGRHGITSKDTNMDFITVCQNENETPIECVEQLASKYNLDRIDKGW